MYQHTATGWALRNLHLMQAAQKAAPSAETREQAVACEVRRADVDPAIVEDIERTVRLASRTLGLDPQPRLRWLPAETRGLRGIVFDDAIGEIWVKVQARDAAKDTVLHELRHVWQLRGDRYKSVGLLTYDQRQADADDFARTWSPFDQPAPVVTQRSAPAPRVVSSYSVNPRDLWPKRETYQEKGITYVVCELCDEGVPLNITHRCRAAGAVTGRRY